jgi:predicted nucleic acid-binding protein
MSAKAFVDSNVLVYAHDKTAGEKRERAAALVADFWHSCQGCLSVQVLQEFYTVMTRKHLLTPVATEQLVERYTYWTVHEPGVQDVMSAIRLHQSALISFWDAMILTSAARLGCETIWSEDLNAGQRLGGVRVRNPFAS